MSQSEAISCYIKDGHLLLSPLRRTRTGARLEAEPVVSVTIGEPEGENESPAAEVVDAVFESLRQSLVPHGFTGDYRTYTSPVLSLVSARSQRSFLKGSRYCCVERVKDEYWVTPGVPAAGGFDFSADGEERVQTGSPREDLVRAILNVLRGATEHR